MRDSGDSALLYVLAFFGAAFMAAASTPYPERLVWSMFAELELPTDCDRLDKCLNSADDLARPYSYKVTRDDSKNACIVTKMRPGHPQGDYTRVFHIPELRGSLRACEMLNNLENQRKFGI